MVLLAVAVPMVVLAAGLLILLLIIASDPTPFEPILLPRNGQGFRTPDGHVFVRKDERKNVTRLRCQRRSDCTATAEIREGVLYTDPLARHSHDPVSQQAQLFRDSLMEDVRLPANVRSSLLQIYERKREEFVPHGSTEAQRMTIIADLPTYDSVRSSMSRVRLTTLPLAPQKVTDIDTNWIKQLEIDGQSILLEDTGSTDEKRILLFGNPKHVEKLHHSDEIHMDGTFWVTPKHFYQMLTWHVMICGQMFPVLYALLPDKSAGTYLRLFRMISTVLVRHGVAYRHKVTFVSDFESGLISAIKEYFPVATFSHRGCYFHYAQSIYRKVAEYGLSVLYKQGGDFRLAIQSLIALGHVPERAKYEYLGIIMQNHNGNEPFKHFVRSYFAPTWFGKFELKMWDWHLVDIRTNNHVEGFHSEIKSHFEQPNLSFYRFLLALHEQIRITANKIAGRITGMVQKPRKRKTVDRSQKAVMEIHREFGTAARSPQMYLQGLLYHAPQPKQKELQN